MNFTITPAAQKFMRMMLRVDGPAGSGFRLAVSPGGCSGLAATSRCLPRPCRAMPSSNVTASSCSCPRRAGCCSMA